MPYDWIRSPTPERPASGDVTQELRLWPYQSLSRRGQAAFILGTFALSLLPLLISLGTPVLWGLLPFAMLTLAGLWTALERSRRDAGILEVLTLSPDRARLVRHDPHGTLRQWECNRYWASPALYIQGGPIPHYVTLKGAGREVEIGAFLSERERKTLYGDLLRALQRG